MHIYVNADLSHSRNTDETPHIMHIAHNNGYTMANKNIWTHITYVNIYDTGRHI